MTEGPRPEAAPSAGARPGQDRHVRSSSHDRRRWQSLVVTGWCLLSGYFLLLTPLGDLVWNDEFWADAPALQHILHVSWVRYGVSAVGATLLALGILELASYVARARSPC